MASDWAYGYDTRSIDDGSLVIAIEAKQGATHSSAEPQLLAYLAIMREQRGALFKTNVVVQGFYGRQYTFMSIENGGVVHVSSSLAVVNTAGRKTVFNFVVRMLDTAMKSTPTASPTKHSEKCDKQVACFDKEVWGRAYHRYGIPPPEIGTTDEYTVETAELV